MRKKHFLMCFVITIALIFNFHSSVFADVGSFESYSSGGSSSSGSSWSSGSSSWGSSSSSSSSSRRRSSYNNDNSVDLPGFVYFIIIGAVVVIVFISKNGKGGGYVSSGKPLHQTSYIPPVENEAQIEAKIKAVDELFNKEEFLSWAKNLFVKLQEAWTDRDWSTIRTFETNELYEQHKKQLQGYIDAKQINMMERICVKYASLADFEQVGDKDVLTIRLSSKMIDYIIDENTNKIIKGDKVTERHSTYKMVFVRHTGIKTEGATGEIRTTNCPNCGAPTDITSSGKCSYCGSVITTDEHDWALSNLEKIM